MTCHSGGSVDIYLEPVLPVPTLLVFGVAPAAQAVARLGKVMGYTVVACDPDADRGSFPDADRLMHDRRQRRMAAVAARAAFAVVATLGQHDEEATQAALGLQPAYLGVVASRKRFAQMRETLVARGVTHVGTRLDRESGGPRHRRPRAGGSGAQHPGGDRPEAKGVPLSSRALPSSPPHSGSRRARPRLRHDRDRSKARVIGPSTRAAPTTSAAAAAGSGSCSPDRTTRQPCPESAVSESARASGAAGRCGGVRSAKRERACKGVRGRSPR